MPKVSETPEGFHPYEFLGLELRVKAGGRQATADCLFCGKEDHFGINHPSTKFRCVVCGETGNAIEFVRKLWTVSDQCTKPQDYKDLAKHRKLAQFETVMRWGLAVSVLDGCWLVPGYNASGTLNTVYRYVRGSNRRLLLPVPGLGHWLHGVNLYNPECETTYICEGPWDAMMLWEKLGLNKEVDGGLVATSDRVASLLSRSSVLAVPGCGVFNESWLPLFEGRRVRLCYDSDHPRINPKTGAPVAPAGYAAMQRVAAILGTSRGASVQYLRWGTDGYNPELKSGADVSDIIITDRE